MAAFNKFNQFTDDLAKGVHNLATGALKVMLTNAAPAATNTVKANLTEIGAGNGYAAGGSATTGSLSNAGGVEKLICTDVTITASGGSIGPFRYAVLYNDTPTAPADPLIAWWDYGSSLTLNVGESILIDFDGSAGVLTIG